MKRWLLIPTMVFAIAMLCLAACHKPENATPTENNLDRKPMLVNYASNYIVPGYAAMLADMQSLKSKAESFVNLPTEENLGNLQFAWRTAYINWQKVSMLEFGPAEEVSLRTFMNTYPVTVSKVNSNITAGSYDLEEFGNKDAQGFPALDYLLNGIGTTPQDIIGFYITDASATARKAYLLAVTDKMLAKVQKVQSGWETYNTD